MEENSKIMCSLLKDTYNMYFLDSHPKLKDIFIQTRDLYEKSPEKFPHANKIFMSLLYNLSNSENIPIVDYITGPGVISKWESTKYTKTIYLFGENDHSNQTGCSQTYGEKHKLVQTYLMELFKHSPVFIDFYVEFGIMLDYKEYINTTTGQTLWDMMAKMHGCFGPLIDRNCNYNVRMHGVDVRSIKSNIYTSSNISNLSLALMMEVVLQQRKKSYIPFNDFKRSFKYEIHKLSKVKTNDDLIKIIVDDIKNNPLIMKEISRSTLSYKQLIDFFVKKELNNNLSKICLYQHGSLFLGHWFKKLKNTWPSGIRLVSNIMTLLTAVNMDIYTAARMFKVFNVKKSEHFPKEPHNIIYYAGTGHTQPLGRFLQELKFKKTEDSGDNILSCIYMEKIKQPLFS